MSIEERLDNLEKQVAELNARTVGSVRLGPGGRQDDTEEADRAIDEIIKTVEQKKQGTAKLAEILDPCPASRKCPKCGGAMGHFRLHGIRCLNQKCPGPYGGGNETPKTS